MSEGGTFAGRLAEVQRQIDEEGKKWHKAGLPGPKPLYRMNDDEFMHHVHVIALTRLIKDKLDLSDDEINLYLHEEFLRQMQAMLPMALEARSNNVRQKIVDGVQIIAPKIDPEI